MIRELDGQNPDLGSFAGAKSYRSQDSITAVRLQNPLAVRNLLGLEYGEPGDYLAYHPRTGHASIVKRSVFEATYFASRELDGGQAKKTSKTYSIA